MLRDIKLEYKKSDEANNSFISGFLAISNLLANQTVKTSLLAEPYFNDVGTVYSIRYLLLIIDRTKLQTDFNYIDFIRINFLGNNITQNYAIPFSIQDKLNTYIAGISGLRYINVMEPSFQFMIYTSSATTVQTLCNRNNSIFFFSLWATTYQDCDAQWINNGTHCTDTCNTTQYFDFITKKCKVCGGICLTCYDANSCSSCIAGQNRVLKNLSCVPIDGYYD
jgi:hypothetical protein